MFETNKPFWRKILSIDGFAVALISGVTACILGTVKYFVVDKPAQQATAALNLEVQRLTRTNADVAEQQNNPSVDLALTCSQSDSVEDIREIRLRVLATNVGGADAELHALQLDVEEGVPTEDVQQDLELTQKFFAQRNLLPEKVFPVQIASATTPLQRRDSYVDTPNQGVNHECRHGRIYSISNNSKQVSWQRREHACETIETKQLLKPKQSLMHEYVFVLTEYPGQHNRQWLRFEINASWVDPKSGKTVNGTTEIQEHFAQSEVIVPGLPLTAVDAAKTVAFTPTVPMTSTNTKGNVWRSEAPTVRPLRKLQLGPKPPNIYKEE